MDKIQIGRLYRIHLLDQISADFRDNPDEDFEEYFKYIKSLCDEADMCVKLIKEIDKQIEELENEI